MRWGLGSVVDHDSTGSAGNCPQVRASISDGGPHAGQLPVQGEVILEATLDKKTYVEHSWETPAAGLPIFTTSRPSSTSHRRPAGLDHCQQHEVDRWVSDQHRCPPNQYKDENCMKSSRGVFKTPSIAEREAILGFPVGFTRQCLSKVQQNSTDHMDCRLTLLGNSWSVPVITWLLSFLLHRLGFMDAISIQEIVTKLAPGQAPTLQGLLLRPAMNWSTSTQDCSEVLVRKFCGLVSLKGEDILLQHQTDVPVKYHRLRMSLPSKLWRWKTVSGWKCIRPHQCSGTKGRVNCSQVASRALEANRYEMSALGGLPCSAPRFEPRQVVFKEDETHPDAVECLSLGEWPPAPVGLCGYSPEPCR